MNRLPDTVTELLGQLADESRDELNLVRALADAMRRADEQVLREVRSVTLHHELRREEIMTELHTLATRLCALPPRPLTAAPRATIHHQPQPERIAEAEPPRTINGGGDWREAAKQIDEEIAMTFGSGLPRH